MAVNNSLTVQSQNEAKSISGYLGNPKRRANLATMLGGEKECQKFISSILSATTANPDLQNCDYGTVVSSALLANALNLSLSPTLGLAYIVPYKDNKNNRIVATFILGYKGYIQLAIRSGYYRKLNVVAIKQGELKSYNRLTEDIEIEFIENDEQRESLPKPSG